MRDLQSQQIFYDFWFGIFRFPFSGPAFSAPPHKPSNMHVLTAFYWLLYRPTWLLLEASCMCGLFYANRNANRLSSVYCIRLGDRRLGDNFLDDHLGDTGWTPKRLSPKRLGTQTSVDPLIHQKNYWPLCRRHLAAGDSSCSVCSCGPLLHAPR